jgi:hypothetical protein
VGAPLGAGSATVTAAAKYAAAHGGGTLGVSSQSSAATAVISGENVAGLGGFSGRESSVSAAWLAAAVGSGQVRWVLVDSSQGRGVPGDTRTGSKAAMTVVANTCRAVTFTTGQGAKVTIYDCQGRAAAILSAAKA